MQQTGCEAPHDLALLAMTAHRLACPWSKLACYEQWLADDVYWPEAHALALEHLYRAMDFLLCHIESLEQEIFFRTADLFNADMDLIFWDTTALYCEIDDEDEASEQWQTRTIPALRKRGYNKEGRDGNPQVVVGLALTRDGLPVRSWVFPGNTADVTTITHLKEDLRGWRLNRCVFVGDSGMFSEANRQRLSRALGRYILAVPMRKVTEVSLDVLTRPGRYRDVAPHLRVKEVYVGEGERRRRYVVCHNPHEEKHQRAHRQQVLRELEAELASLQEVRGESHSKRVCQLRASQHYGRYLRLSKGGLLRIDAVKRRAAEQLDGKFVVHSNDDSLSPADLALGYKQLQRVEEAWRTLKSGLRARPVYHGAVHRIHAHVALSVLALLLERVIEQTCGDTWRNIRAALEQIKLAQLLSPHGEVWQVTQSSPEAANHLKDLDIKHPPAIVHLR
jgi:transposase